ncbi:MAG: hypothetical protein JXB38_14415 [Anaerolineales bacterium]|nr:hypothetical protein [Anaerolineales bacterium]
MNGVTTQYTLDLNAGLTQVLDGGTNVYLYGSGRIAEEALDEWDYYLTDALGSVRQLTDASGDVTYAEVYTPFGEVLSSAGVGESSYGFAGEWTDATGMQYLRARYYAPYLNQFIQPDTIVPDSRIPSDWNKYTYVRNNPINFTDPSGQTPYRAESYEVNDARDLTQWLYNEMVWNARNDPVVNRLRNVNKLAGTLTGVGLIGCGAGLILEPASPLLITGGGVILIGAGAVHAGALYTFGQQVKNGARWDFKDEIGIQLGQGVTFCGMGMCYDDIEYSVAGNIFYGYIGRASGFAWWEIKGGAAWAEQNDPSHDPNSPEYVPDAPLGERDFSSPDPVVWNLGDEKHDNAAVTFGIKLWNNHRMNLTLAQFKSELNAYVNQLQRHAPSAQPVNEQYAKYWPYSVGHFNNIGRAYVPGQP